MPNSLKNISIPIDIPADLFISLNESEKELKNHFQISIALMLFQEGKLTMGKAIQLSGLSRYEFEKVLVKNNIDIVRIDKEQIKTDLQKLKDL